MTCRSCQQARTAGKSALKAFASGNLRQAAEGAKEMAEHIRDKLAESERVRALMGRKPRA